MPRSRIRVCCVLQFVAALSLASTAHAQVAIGFNGSGLASLQYAGTELLASGALRVNRIVFQSPSGATYDADLSASVAVDAQSGAVENRYAWGTVSARYEVHGNRLDIALSVSNRAGDVIKGVFLEPLELRLPEKPVEYDNVTPIMIYDVGEPGVLGLTTNTMTVALGYEDPGEPIIAGFPWANDRPASTRFPFRVNTDREPGYPDSYPLVVRPIAAGASDQYHFSLRFGGPGSTVASLTSDVNRQFAAKFPPTLHWADKRPIGQLVLATSAAGFPRNPRGWLLDGSIDTTTPAGRAAFRARVLAWADESVTVMTQLNAQGMITWDIEGEEFPHATTYLCDPRALWWAAPEMDAIADEYFRKFTDAGFRVGVCVRPQTLVVNGQGVSQQPSADPGQVLIDKIAYAKARWGATLFYVDSNGDPGLPLDAGIIQRVAAAHPDVLIIPEHENTRYYAYTAPYRELRQNQVSTPDRVRLTYPDAFGVTYVADGDFGRYFNDLVTAVDHGDSLMTRGWFPDSANGQVQRIYSLVAPAPPSPPAVGITSPVNGSVVSGAVALTANATSAARIVAAQFSVNGAPYGAALGAPPFSATLDTTTLPDGPVRIGITVRDETGREATSEVTVTVSNRKADTEAPGIALTAPVGGASVSGVVSIAATASDNVGVTSVEFYVDGTAVGAALTSAPYAASWNSASVSDGQHTIAAVARDAGGNVTVSTPVVVTVRNVAAAPSCGVVPEGAFAGCYYNRLDFAELFATRLDPAIDFNWGDTAPFSGMSSQNYTIRWQGQFTFTGGDYRFMLDMDDGARLYIDGERVWDVWGEHWQQRYETTLRVSPGVHVVRLDYVQFSGKAVVSFNWSKSGS